MKAQLLTMLLTLCCLLLLAGPLLAQNPEKVKQLMTEGDEFAEKTFDNQKALKSYQEALTLDPNNFDLLWRISRAYVDIGEHLPAGTEMEKQAQLDHYAKALDFAKKAIAANASGSMGYTRKAIANGRIALFKGIWESLDLVKQTKADCEKAISLDPNNAAVYYVLARTHLKVCEKPKIVRWPLGLGWANLEESVKLFEKAIALRPEFAMYKLDCARAYVELDEFNKARTHLTAMASLPKLDEDDDQFKKEAKELLDKIKNE
ncbi:MAG: hypothetical protein V1799_14215 [bacterium]